MDRSVRSRTSSTSSVRSPAAPSTPAPTPSLAIGPGGRGQGARERGPSPDQLAASLARLRAERALVLPGAPATTPSPATPHPGHSLHPEAILDSLSQLGGGDEGIASGSLPSTPAPTPFSPSPSVAPHVTSDQIAASIQRLREEGVGSMASTQPTTPSSTPAYPPHLPLPGGQLAPNLGVIPEHLAEGMNNIFRGADNRGGADSGGGQDSGSAPCTPTPTPFSPSPAQHSVLAEQLAAGISRLKVEEGMSSGGSTGFPSTPAPTPFSLGPTGILPEDLVAGISRLSVIQEADIAAVAIAVHGAGIQAPGNTSGLSTYFGSPLSSGDSVFDSLATPGGRPCRSRAGSEGQSSQGQSQGEGQGTPGGFQDVTIGTPAKRPPAPSAEEEEAPAPAPGPAPLSLPLPAPLPLERPHSPARSVSVEEAALAAWPPGPATREALAALAAGNIHPVTARDLTAPGVAPGSEQGDPVRAAVAKYQGEAEAAKRQLLTSDGVTSDLRGLQQLLRAGNYRAAVNHTAGLLELYGQGSGRAGTHSKHSPSSLQVWWVRLALLVKLRHFSVAETEAAAFGDLDRPDLYYEFYPSLHSGRQGSMAPWALRLLLAELPGHCGRQLEAMNRLLRLLRSVRQLLGGQEAGRAVWREREVMVLHSLVNCAIMHQDFESAVKCLDMLGEVVEPEPEATGALHSAYGRLYLQLGSLPLAERHFGLAAAAREVLGEDGRLDTLLDSAFLAIGQGQFQAALERFLRAEAAVAAGGDLGLGKLGRALGNNIAVCLLYVGRLKEGLAKLEASVTGDTENIQANPILNLCTLYELESSYAMQKKIGMLGLVSLHCSDSFAVSSLKL